MSQTSIRRIFHLSACAVRKAALRPHDAMLSVRMALWVVLISVSARLTSLPRTQKIAAFRFRSAPHKKAANTPDQLKQTIDGVLGIELFMFRKSCWRRALVLHRFLALNGLESRINFGLRKEADGNIAGHAWLEHEGQPLLEDDAAGSYVVTFSLPTKPAAPQLSTSS
jgi:hypothetical protein